MKESVKKKIGVPQYGSVNSQKYLAIHISQPLEKKEMNKGK
jgi:hypothetical protein